VISPDHGRCCEVQDTPRSPGLGKSRRTSRTWEVAAVVPDVAALARELAGAGVHTEARS
jgi:hypothetical protein